MPYAEVAIHAKKGEPLLDLANTAGGIARDELLAYALVFNPEVRHGVRALLAVMTLVIAINIGADYFVLYAAIAVLALFALIKISRGCAEIL